ncbi:MAG: phosphate ABC transporter permease PstA [Planctomycetes bacterium]|nr:phosphate ABC transporter permease PstA [Planctomycetota bacterium]
MATSRWTGRLLDVCVWGTPVIVAGMFLWLISDLILRGSAAFQPGTESTGASYSLIAVAEQILRFLTAAPERAGRGGGIGPILVSTGMILAVCMSVVVPIGLGTAMFLSELVSDQNRLGRLVRRSLDLLAGVPSIVFGLFGNAVFCQWLGFRYSIVAGGLTLACMVLPLLIRSAEEGFRSVPDSQRHAAAALGFSRWSTVFRVILPQSTPGIVAGLILGLGRALAETAALLFTSGYVDRMPRSFLDSGRSLSIHIYDLSMNVPGGNQNAHASALVLVVLLILINLTAHRLTYRFLHREVRYA